MVYIYPRKVEQEVWKFLLEPPDEGNTIAVTMPHGSKPLSVAFQGPELYLWALVNVDAVQDKEYLFQVYGTGHRIPAEVSLDIDHLGTAYSEGLVFHVFTYDKGRSERSRATMD